MKRTGTYLFFFFVFMMMTTAAHAQSKQAANAIETAFLHPPASAKPWVFWYWMQGAVSKAGITADLEAMKQVGIGGAYLMPIKDTSAAIPFQPTVRQLSPEWWAMVKFAMQESKRLGLQLGMHVSDGFALAGGPWITPELSMQKLVWTKTFVQPGQKTITLDQPETNEGYYKDVAVMAYAANSHAAFSGKTLIPTVTASNGSKPQFLSFPDETNKQSFKSDTACWIQYKYPEPVTCRSIKIHIGGNNYQALRLVVQSSDDGHDFSTITRLKPPRHGWQDSDEDYTWAIPPTTARYFRFCYDKLESEPGSEDLDAAKWKPSLKLMGIYLSDEPVINQFEAKNGSVWRVADNTVDYYSQADAGSSNSIIDLSGKMDANGNLNWTAPDGNWVVARIGHTSTGHTNATGGGGKGLECDKFNAAAITLQFNNWFGKAFEKCGPELAKQVLKIFHVDSWECGSQNWSTNFLAEFKKRRGYELKPYLLLMTGVPINDAATSEKVLHDVRQTIADLVVDVFYETLRQLSAEKGCQFSAESIAPTMVSDGLLHYKKTDLPMGEFWLNSPTHDKPNDMLDAISGAHIYGKNIIQAEAFTSVRMNWAEHPGNLKAVGDRNFALGINKMVLHVFAHNPWMDKKPGMTLDGVGLYFQRDQTWFKQSKAWIEYLTRCQALLQLGKPVVDIAVFTGEEIPRRAVLPDRLIGTLPGIFGNEKVQEERTRFENAGQPLRQIPDGVSHSANMADPELYTDALNGYKYDCFNPDVLMSMTVKDGRVITPTGASYGVLIIPGKHPMHPNNTLASVQVVKKLLQLAKDGARIILDKNILTGIGMNDPDQQVSEIAAELTRQKNVLPTPYMESSFENLDVPRDVVFKNGAHTIEWTHRKFGDEDIYFLANSAGIEQDITMSFPSNGNTMEFLRPTDGASFQNLMAKYEQQNSKDGRTEAWVRLAANESVFIIFTKKPTGAVRFYGSRTIFPPFGFLNPWYVSFDKNFGGPRVTQYWNELKSWTSNSDSSIKYYSGTVVYRNTINLTHKKPVTSNQWVLSIDKVFDIATVKVNGVTCGTMWTPPYELDITKAVKEGTNTIEIEVANTWHNRLIGDNLSGTTKKITWTTAPFRLKDKPLEPAGIIGSVIIEGRYKMDMHEGR